MGNIVKTAADIKIAEAFASSSKFPKIKTSTDALVLILIGRSIGLTEFESMQIETDANGKPIINAHMMASAIKRSGKYNYTVVEYSDTVCRIQFYEKLGEEWHELGKPLSWDINKEAKHLNRRATWKDYGRRMLFCRCISEGYRTYCPDALGMQPFYVEGEIDQKDNGPEQTFGSVDLPIDGPICADELELLRSLIGRVETFEDDVAANMANHYQIDCDGAGASDCLDKLTQSQGMAAVAILKRKIAKHDEANQAD